MRRRWKRRLGGLIVRGKVAIRWIFLFTRISQRNMVVRTPTNIIRLVANFVSHGKTTFYHILPPSYHLSGLPNIFRCERRKGHKLIEDVYLIEEKNFFQKKFYVGESGNWIITNQLITKKIHFFYWLKMIKIV